MSVVGFLRTDVLPMTVFHVGWLNNLTSTLYRGSKIKIETLERVDPVNKTVCPSTYTTGCRARECLKKNMNAPRPSEHPPVRGENVKTFFRCDHRPQTIQNLFIAFKRVPRS